MHIAYASRFLGSNEFIIVRIINAQDKVANTALPIKPELRLLEMASKICHPNRLVATKTIAAGDE